jgi:hypothetical protein
MPSDFESYAVGRLDELEARDRRLRRRVTRLTVLVAAQGVLLLYLLLPVGRLGVPKYLEASRFVLVDDRGRVRGQLVDDQGPQLELLTEDGQSRAVLWVNHDESAALLLMDNRGGGGRGASVSAHDDGAWVQLSDQKGERVLLELSDQQSGLQKIPAPPARSKP